MSKHGVRQNISSVYSVRPQGKILIDAHLVLSVIQRFQGRGESPDDLFQVGCIGLMKSIDHFNTELGVRFSTYAVPMNGL